MTVSPEDWSVLDLLSDRPTQHNESPSSAAIDGARISVFVAQSLVAMDPELPAGRREAILEGLTAARAVLDEVRDLFPVIITSLHTVPGGDR